jgi:23S rRNA pseudouridine1911/1915/1917 synthase
MSDPTLKTRLLSIIVRDLPNKKKGNRADLFLALQEGLPSRSQLKAWFEQGLITRSGKPLAAKDRVLENEVICVQVPAPKPLEMEARPIPLQIFFEDDELMVVMKPRGLSMHPGASHDDQNTLVHALLYHARSSESSARLSDLGGEFRPGIVHRLDKDTEGLVVIAKNNETHQFLSKQFADRTIDRSYWAVCFGKLPERLEIDAPIGRHPRDRKKMAVVQRGREARTLVERLAYSSDGFSWVRCKLFSGRTHQIRVHLAHKGFPLLNDPVYGSSRRQNQLPQEIKDILSSVQGQCLIAFELGFEHPKTHERMYFKLGMPEWIEILIQKIQRHSK